MIRNRILLKSFAAFFIIEMVVNTVAPAVSWALTAGPTAPEATSFEPVDTTDMVNLATGDLAYNIPLLEVPGPSGGYPLSLSYHAGIQPNEEASWTGLGWTLNPGAIVRNVNGFADDQQNQPNFSRYYWEGGKTKTYNIGVSVGIAGSPASVSAGLSFSQDTYQGSGVGANFGIGFAPTGGSSARVGLSTGISPYGDAYASAGLQMSNSTRTASNLSAGVGVTTNFKSVGFNGSVGMNNASLDATISTRGVSANVSLRNGPSVSNNSQSGRISSALQGFGIPIRVGLASLDLGYSYNRYWIDEIDASKINGSLYYPNNSSELDSYHFDENAYDTYSLVDKNLGVVDEPNPDKVLGGSFPSFDNYLVHAQGISGYMRPYYFQKHLYKRNNYNRNSANGIEYQTIQYDISKSNPGENNFRAEFRFVNDFSNRFEFTPGQISHESSDIDVNPLKYNFSDGFDIKVGENGANSYTSNQVQGSSHINWFTNQDILSQSTRVISSGFIETVSTGFNRATPLDKTDDNSIGGFVVINESGVKYHFALPAYSYEDYIYSENKKGTQTFNEFNKTGKYAYTWYLTGITGPDYVDRGLNGIADGKLNEYDWGYWVEFEYGKWTENYPWRNPSEGMMSDLDQNFQNFSSGVKELYYLDAIRTKTHTALFFKDIKDDGKSSLFFLRDRVIKYYGLGSTNVTIKSKDGVIPPDLKSGGFRSKNESCNRTIYYYQGNENEVQDYKVKTEQHIKYVAGSTSTVKLKKIFLIDNKSLSNIPLTKFSGERYAQELNAVATIDYETHVIPGNEPTLIPQFNRHLYSNVYDVDDLSKVRSEVKKHALRAIEFNTDYSICPETVNNFDYKLPPTEGGSNYFIDPKPGKLTLNSIKFLGKKEADLTPSIKFQYDLDSPLRGSNLLTHSDIFSFTQLNSGLVAGDLLKLTGSSGTCYALVVEITNNTHKLKILGENAPEQGIISWQQTKNPPYNKDAYDSWGLYKSDFDLASAMEDEHLGRSVTETSSKSLDVWSLRSIETVTGATIELEYESDTYSKPVLYQSNNLIVENVEKISSTESKITLANSFAEMSTVLKSNMKLDYLFLFIDAYEYAESTGIAGGGYNENMNEGSIIITSLDYINNKWVIKTNSNLDEFYRIKVDPTHRVFYDSPLFVAGNVSALSEVYNTGGGIRVRCLQLKSFDKIKKTSYTYTDPASVSTNYTSGVTSYEPDGMDNVKFYFLEQSNFSPFQKENFEKTYKRALYKKFEKILFNSREIPPPGVLYKFVKVSESVINNSIETPLEQYSIYEFEVFKNNDVDIQYTNGDIIPDFSRKIYTNNIGYNKKEKRNVTIKDYTSRIGALKKVTLYDNSDNIISQTTNQYLHDESSDNAQYESELLALFKNQGVIEETFSDARFVARKNTDYVLQGVISKREQYPVIQIGQTTVNYKSGITASIENIAFDFYSGQVIKTLSTDGYGNSYLSEVTPAYRKYDAMGLAINGGKNMLTQEAASYSYKVDPTNYDTKLGLVSASVQTWSDKVPAVAHGQSASSAIAQNGIWRKHASYSFIGDNTSAMLDDGLYPIPNNVPPSFSAWNRLDPIPDGWQKNGEITLYDVNSHALEATDVNNNYAATKLNFDQSRVLVTGANCKYDEIAYSGAEEQPKPDQFNLPSFGGGVNCSGIWSADQAHTGKYSVKAAPESAAYSYTFIPEIGPYVVSFWSSKPAAAIKYQLDATTPQNAAVKKVGQAGSWHLLEATITVPAGYGKIKIWNEASAAITYFDDFRVHPLDAAVVSYVYNEWGELSHVLDNNNLYTEYRYDGMGRLNETYRETFQAKYGAGGIAKINEINYNYGRNNPFTVKFTVSSTGNLGSIQPTGISQVLFNGEHVITLQSSCGSGIEIDGKLLTLTGSNHILPDGTFVTRSGSLITFKNVKGAHTVVINFGHDDFEGIYHYPELSCYNAYESTGSGPDCFDGSYEYSYLDACLENRIRVVVPNWISIPEPIRRDRIQANYNCCEIHPPQFPCICNSY